MVLILSDENDYSTQQVLNWLMHKNKPFLRLNRTSSVTLMSLHMLDSQSQFTLKTSEHYLPGQYRLIHSSEISAYWYRRGYLNLEQQELIPAPGDEDIDYRLKKGINEYLYRENAKVGELLNHHLRNIPHLGSVFDNAVNKFINSLLASQLGLLTPKSLITGSKSAFLSFNQCAGSCIVKSLDRAGFTIENKIGLGNTTVLVSPDMIQMMPERFNLTLFQEFIDKLYDIRVFFLNDRFYTACILSQSNEQTRVDFRNYDDVKPNRIVPFKLPEDIEHKLSKLMEILKMKTGSIDLLKDKKGSYYFLEVNPIGQYGFISERCNFHLDKQIADEF